MARAYGSALVPDFQQFYGLRFTEVAVTWPVVEVLLLIQGLPENSRYAARRSGEATSAGWSTTDWVTLDIRNATEGLRATVVSALAGKRKDVFRKWNHYPGREAQTKVRQKKAVAKIASMATPATR